MSPGYLIYLVKEESYSYFECSKKFAGEGCLYLMIKKSQWTKSIVKWQGRLGKNIT